MIAVQLVACDNQIVDEFSRLYCRILLEEVNLGSNACGEVLRWLKLSKIFNVNLHFVRPRG